VSYRRRGPFESRYEYEESSAKDTQFNAGCFFLVVAGALVLWNLYQAIEMSSNLHWASNFRLTRAGAQEEVARYPAGAEVTVYYDPDFPGTAVLQPGFNRHFVFDIVVGLLIIALAFLAMNAAFAQAAKVLMRYNRD